MTEAEMNEIVVVNGRSYSRNEDDPRRIIGKAPLKPEGEYALYSILVAKGKYEVSLDD